MFTISKKDFKGDCIVGIDEVGRGPFAGPVVAAAVLIDCEIEGVKDSKLLSEKKREELDVIIRKQAHAVGYGIVEAEEIDRINIKQATRKAMTLAVEDLKRQGFKPDVLLIDAEILDIDIEQHAFYKGDRDCYDIACASVVAKVYRDEIMRQYSRIYPAYDFENNKGYGTAKHREALKFYGPCPIHRRTFIRRYIDE